jgi:DNA-binding PadR family transcriptional regulator
VDQVLTGEDVRITRAIMGSLRGRNLSGFEMWKWLGPIHGTTGTLNEAVLYPTLYRLEAAGMIEGRWSEEERTRRRYRMTATGRTMADKQGWNDVAFRLRRGEPAESGSGSGDGDGEWSWPPEPPEAPGPDEDGGFAPAAAPDSPEAIAAAAYVRRLDASLELPVPYRTEVCDEIDHHLTDSSQRFQTQGLECADAMDQAIAELGPADVLAAQINTSQHTENRLNKGLEWASAVAMVSGVIGIGLTWFVLTFFLFAAPSIVVGVAEGFGTHLYMPTTGELHAEAFGLAGWIGAFAAARRSMPQLALHSHRSPKSVGKLWALTGAVPLLLAAVLIPAGLDPLVAFALLGIPIAWALGTMHPARLYGPTLTTRGVVVGLVIVVAMLFIPGGRVWGFDPTSGPAGAAPFQSGVPVQVTWAGTQTAGTWQVNVDLSGAQGWHDPKVEVWPAVRSSVGIVPDPAAKAPSAVDQGGAIDFSVLNRRVTDWWATVTAIGPDGLRHTIAAGVEYGNPVKVRTSIAGWLIGLVRH